MSQHAADTEPDHGELFAMSRARVERYEPLTTGLLLGYKVTDGYDVTSHLEYNMLNALRAAAPDPHTEFEITEHSPTRWTCRHRQHDYVLKVWGWQQERQQQPQ